MAPLTWKNIQAPSFSDALQGIKVAGESFGSAGKSFSDTLGGVQKVQEANWDTQADINTQDILAGMRSAENLGELNQMDTDPTAFRNKFGAQFNPDAVAAGEEKLRSRLQGSAAQEAANFANEVFDRTGSKADASIAFKTKFQELGAKDPGAIAEKTSQYGTGDLATRVDKFTETIGTNTQTFLEENADALKTFENIDGLVKAAGEKYGKKVDKQAIKASAMAGITAARDEQLAREHVSPQEATAVEANLAELTGRQQAFTIEAEGKVTSSAAEVDALKFASDESVTEASNHAKGVVGWIQEQAGYGDSPDSDIDQAYNKMLADGIGKADADRIMMSVYQKGAGIHDKAAWGSGIDQGKWKADQKALVDNLPTYKEKKKTHLTAKSDLSNLLIRQNTERAKSKHQQYMKLFRNKGVSSAASNIRLDTPTAGVGDELFDTLQGKMKKKPADPIREAAARVAKKPARADLSDVEKRFKRIISK